MEETTSIDINRAIGRRQGLFTLIIWNFLLFALCRFVPEWEQLFTLTIPAMADTRAGAVIITAVRTLTYTFVHNDVLHLCVNMFWLLILGYPLYPMIGVWRFFGLYAGGGVAGALLFIIAASTEGFGSPVFAGSLPVALCGASAAILSIATAAWVLSHKIPHPYGNFIKSKYILPILALAAILLTIVCNLSIYAFAAHAGGIIFGGITASIMNKNLKL